MDDTQKRIQELADLIVTGYKNLSIINSDKRILKPTLVTHNDNFTQLGLNLIIPMWVFEGTADNSMIAAEYAKSLRLGEINYLIKQIEESQKDKKTEILNEATYTGLLKILRNIDATDVFIPLDIFSEMEPDLYKEKTIERDGFYEYIIVGNNKIRVHWSNKFIQFNKIFLLDSSGVEWKQKVVKNMLPPKNFENSKDLTDTNDIIQIRYEPKSKDINLLLRLVFTATVNPEKAKIVDISKSIQTRT